MGILITTVGTGSAVFPILSGEERHRWNYNSSGSDVPSPRNFGSVNYRCVIDEARNHPEMQGYL